MKHFIFTKQDKWAGIICLAMFTACVTFLLTSCQHIDESEFTNTGGSDSSSSSSVPTKNVKFKVTNLTTDMTDFDTATATDGSAVGLLSKAALTDASLTDLYVYAGDTLLVHQQSTDTDFGAPNIKMKYGPHKLAFIATKGTTNTLTDSIFTPNKVKDTFAKYCTLTVNSTTLQQSVTMERYVSALKLSIEDATTAAIATCEITIGNYGTALILPYLHGCMETNHVSTVTIPSNYLATAGGTLTTYLYTPEKGTAYTTTVQIDFKDASGTVLYTHSLTDVPFVTNRITNIHGNFFSSGGITNSISLASTDWDTAYDVSL